MRKIRCTFLVLLLCCAQCLLTSCGFSFNEPYSTSITEAPICHHSISALPSVVASCTATGLTEGLFCTLCGKTITEQTEIPPTGHKPAVTVPAVAPTETGDGSSAGLSCSVCGKVLSEPYPTFSVKSLASRYLTLSGSVGIVAGEYRGGISSCDILDTENYADLTETETFWGVYTFLVGTYGDAKLGFAEIERPYSAGEVKCPLHWNAETGRNDCMLFGDTRCISIPVELLNEYAHRLFGSTIDFRDFKDSQTETYDGEYHTGLTSDESYGCDADGQFVYYYRHLLDWGFGGEAEVTERYYKYSDFTSADGETYLVYYDCFSLDTEKFEANADKYFSNTKAENEAEFYTVTKHAKTLTARLYHGAWQLCSCK